MSRVEGRIRVSRGVGGDQRQVTRISQVDQGLFGRVLDGIAAPADLYIKPVREECLQTVEIGLGLQPLALGE